MARGPERGGEDGRMGPRTDWVASLYERCQQKEREGHRQSPRTKDVTSSSRLRRHRDDTAHPCGPSSDSCRGSLDHPARNTSAPRAAPGAYSHGHIAPLAPHTSPRTPPAQPLRGGIVPHANAPGGASLAASHTPRSTRVLK
ncbi:hypothetical protein HYPSUDRAFT_38441 [Hypholoma sublateritium FD-334 SS-4]|uniref:Uncharacterized protein n=1 Tax=Hypholoma sublateritium (strain FD-334 SS-4) TaxID=945553 RepID=A0A0D2P1K1_HYPSF|nr:hypothetical protein HYPSUDRAFT_38441 [Hypholoma sublateritium FD-334 SS-4]